MAATDPAAVGGLNDRTVRELLVELAFVEDSLRGMPFLVSRGTSRTINPEVMRLLAHQRAIVAQLRSRRVSWRSGETERKRSAAWPPPPWS